MREIIYSALVRLPLKIGAALGWSAGIVSAAIPTKLETLAGQKMSADMIQSIGVVLLALSSVYFALLWLLKSPSRQSGQTGGVVITGGTHHHHYQTLPEKMEIEAVQPAPHAVIKVHSAHHAHHAGEPQITESVEEPEHDSDGLYVGNIVVAAGALHDDHRLDFAIVGYNGTGEEIQISEISGRIRAGVGNVRDMVKLPQPLLQGVLKAAPRREFVFQLRQEVSLEQSQAYLAALEEGQHVALDLRELNITVVSGSQPGNSTRLPLWDGVNLRRRDDVVFE